MLYRDALLGRAAQTTMLMLLRFTLPCVYAYCSLGQSRATASERTIVRGTPLGAASPSTRAECRAMA